MQQSYTCYATLTYCAVAVCLVSATVAPCTKSIQRGRMANSFFVHSPSQGWPVKRSIEAKQICAGKATKTFLCEGTMARHTLKSWACAPCEPHAPHTLNASEDAPIPIFLRRILVEDSMPFSQDDYWVTVWRKCEACQARDEAFKAWVMAAPGEESESEGA